MRPNGSECKPIFGGAISGAPGIGVGMTLYREPHWTWQSPDRKYFASWAFDSLRPREKLMLIVRPAYPPPPTTVGSGDGSAVPAPTVGRREETVREIDVRSTEVVEFETPQGITLNSRAPLVKAAMVILGAAWPKTVPFVELVRAARAKLESTKPELEDVQALGQALLTFYAQASTSLVELWLNPPRFAATLSAKPTASPLARLQAKTKNRVTNLRHESVFLGEFERQLVRLLDGRHDRAALIDALGDLVAKGELTVEKDGQPLKEAEQMRKIVEEAVDEQLKMLARNALLTA